MKKITIFYIIIGILIASGLVYLIPQMSSGLIIILLFILLMLIGVWILLRAIKKKKKLNSDMKTQIPENIIEDFNKAEQHLKGGIDNYDTNNKAKRIDPNSILWEIWKGNRVRDKASGIRGIQQPTINGELLPKPIGRQNIQDGADTNITEPTKNSTESGRFEGVNKRGNVRSSFISRIRRK